MDNIDFASRISELRRERGLSQKELGDMLGVSNKAVSKWENGESLPKTSTMLKLAELLGIDGNELIGFEVKDSGGDNDLAELNTLKQENNALRSQLSAVHKKRKRSFIIIVCVCALCIIAVSIAAVCLEGGIKKSNKSITEAGQQGTKIVFDDITFLPVDALTNYIITNCDINFDSNDAKYADYYNTGGDKQKVLISCSEYSSYISVKAGGRTYYYIKNGSADTIKIEPAHISCIDLYNSSIADNSQSMYDDYSYIVKSYSYYDDDSEKFFDRFSEFYNNKPSAADKKITERYLGTSSRTVTVSLENTDDGYNEYIFDIGEFFKDDDGGVYFYDYVDTTSYPVEKELSKYVYR